MERLIALLEKRRAELKEDYFARPEFDPLKMARRIGAIEELGQAIDLIKEQRRNYEQDD